MADCTQAMSDAELRMLYRPFAFDSEEAPSRQDYRFHRHVSGLGSTLARNLQGGRNADPNVAPAMRTAALLARHLEALVIVHGLSIPPEPATSRPAPAADDLPAMLSDAGRDARYVKSLLSGGGGMATGGNVTTALRVVHTLAPKLEAIWSLYESLPETAAFTGG